MKSYPLNPWVLLALTVPFMVAGVWLLWVDRVTASIWTCVASLPLCWLNVWNCRNGVERRSIDRPGIRRHIVTSEGVVTTNAGFTLVELLVAMTIFVVLATLTIYAFRDATGNDGIPAGASTLRNALEGARSRAIRSGEVRGVRLITDPNDGRIVTSLQYVGVSDFTEGQLRVEFNRTLGAWQILLPAGDWSVLESRGLVDVGNRIEIPAGSGQWRTLGTRIAPDVWLLTGGFQPSEWFVPLNENHPDYPSITVTHAANLFPSWRPVPFAASEMSRPPSTVMGHSETVASDLLTYRLNLSPAPLEGSEPILFPRGICIDLDGSSVPSSWRPATTNESDSYSNRMEILFTPRGTVLGDLSRTGLAHFRISNVADVMLTKSLDGRPLSSAATSPVIHTQPEHGQRLVTLFSTTGAIVISEVDQTSLTANPGPNSNVASQPFTFAIRGRAQE